MDAMPPTLRQRLDSRNAKPHAEAAGPAERDGGKENLRAPPSARSAPSPSPSQCVREVERMRLRREALRGAVEDKRRARADDDGTAEFQQMIAEYRTNLASGGRAGPAPGRAAAPLGANNAQRIRVVVRKRPLLPHERENADYDTVSCAPGGRRIVVHEPKVRVDLQKAMESHLFDVDDVFPEDSSTQQLYARTVGDLVAAMFDGCSATCFTYGQTGSGKTYTMLGKEAALAQADAMAPSRPLSAPDDVGLYHLAVRDCFDQLELLRREGVALYLGVSFFEVYCGGVHDLLNERAQCRVLEDAQGEVQVRELTELVPDSLSHLLEITATANAIRCVGTTSANEHSSRSHAVLQLTLRLAESGASYGRFSLVDLAGSERAADSADAKRTTRNEGAEINKSLLCLKECIRALGAGQAHTPFRGSKLTQVLRDAFIGESARSVMIANVSPGNSSVEHTLNTLRYAVRLSSCAAADAGGAAGGGGGSRAHARGAHAPLPRAVTAGGGAGSGLASPRAGASSPWASGGAGASSRWPKRVNLAGGAEVHAASSAGRARRPLAAGAAARRAPEEGAPLPRAAVASAGGGEGCGEESSGGEGERLSGAAEYAPAAAPAPQRRQQQPRKAPQPRAPQPQTQPRAPSLADGAGPGADTSPGWPTGETEGRASADGAPGSPLQLVRLALAAATLEEGRERGGRGGAAGAEGEGDSATGAAAALETARRKGSGKGAGGRAAARSAQPPPAAAEAASAAVPPAPAEASDEAGGARVERAVGVLSDVLQCAYEPESWREEMRLLREESSAGIAGVRAYAAHLDEVLAERLAMFDELRKQLAHFGRTLA